MLQDPDFELQSINFAYRVDGISTFVNWHPIGSGEINGRYFPKMYDVKVSFKGKQARYQTGLAPKESSSKHLIKTAHKEYL